MRTLAQIGDVVEPETSDSEAHEQLSGYRCGFMSDIQVVFSDRSLLGVYGYCHDLVYRYSN